VLSLAVGAGFFIDVNFVKRPVEYIRAIICLNRDTGEIRWTCDGLRGREAGGESRVVTNASPTPVTDGERVYGYFGKDGLMSVSSGGKLLWKQAEPMFHSRFGAGTSPVVADGVLVVVSDERESDGPSSIAGFDCLSGERLWETERKSHKVDAAYGTPLVKSLSGRKVVIVHGWYDITGYDIKTGEEAWSYPIEHEGRHLVASLVSDAQHLYVTSAKEVVALDISKLGTGTDPLVWSTTVPGEKSSTPVVVDELLFLVTETGMGYCLEAATGQVMWKQRLKGRYFSSVITMGDRVYFTSQSGQTTVVAIGREFRPLAKNSTGESVYASFVPSGSRLFVRTTKHAYSIREDAQ
jgi:outer membrane protein assembly factor BamB